jgi:hypothetical protein
MVYNTTEAKFKPIPANPNNKSDIITHVSEGGTCVLIRHVAVFGDRKIYNNNNI